MDAEILTLLSLDNHQHNVRLDGIDAPENAQPFGRTSQQQLDQWAQRRVQLIRLDQI
jgi:endonuclease YncB( thermonuclease family)